MKTIATVLFLFGLSFAAPAMAGDIPRIDLWNGAMSGMSVDQVAALYDRAQRLNGDTLISGFQEKLRIAPFDLEGEPYTVKFFFDATKLRSVLLSRQFDAINVKTTTASCDKRLTALRRDYGKEIEEETQFEGLFDLNRSFTFQKNGRQALLLCLGSAHTAIVNLAYEPVVAEAGDVPEQKIIPDDEEHQGFFHTPAGQDDRN